MSERPWFQDPAVAFDWDAHGGRPSAGAEVAERPAVYAPQPMPVAPMPQVRTDPAGTPYYAHVPAPQPAYDPLPARMYGCGVMAFGVGIGAGAVEAGSYWMFAGMSLATHALIGVAAIFVSAAISLVLVRTAGGTKIRNFHQGNNSTFIGGNQ